MLVEFGSIGQGVLPLRAPHLGGLVGACCDWTPLTGRDGPYDDDRTLDREDLWQFGNFRVA